MTLQIRLLHNFESVAVNSQLGKTEKENQIIVIKTRKEKALLVYLLLEPGPQQRTRLISMFWPNRPPPNALKNLRQTLYQLDQSLGDHSHLIQRSRSSIGIDNKNTDAMVDVWAFDQLREACRNHSHETVETCGRCHAKMRQLVQLYQGDLFGNWDTENRTPFITWLLQQRTHRKDGIIWALSILSQAALNSGDGQDALELAKRLNIIDPYYEQGVILFMRAAAMTTNRAAALQLYGQYVDLLEDTFAASPSDLLQQLYVQIKLGRSNQY